MEELVKKVNFLNQEIESLVGQLTLLKHECLRLTNSKEKIKLENHVGEIIEKITACDKKREKLLREIEKLANSQ